jgi:LemA protein
MSTATVILIIVGVIVVGIIVLYNNIIGRKNNLENAFGSIDAQLKKRYDLIPNIISSVMKYMEHEKNLLETITKLRTRALESNVDNDEKIEIDKEMNKAIKSLLIAVENYPDLKASSNFINLQKTLYEVESQISAARRNYNSAVTLYNNSLEMFPSSIIAKQINYQRKKVFEIPDEQRSNLDVDKMLNG